MSVPSPQEFRELVRSHTDLVSLIGEAISLQPRHGGRQYVGLCPFHDDHNPSLNVYPDRQTYRCWSCNAGGDCFTFLMEREGVSFPEALELLARRANLPIPQKMSRTSPEQETSKARLLEVLQWAENVFHKSLLELPAAEPARRYLKGRGFTEETVRKYRLGFHPDDWTFLIERAKSKYSLQLLQEARLIGAKEGRHYDYFVNRVLFPIHNERGQAVSFGGRILPGSTDDAKYWNGPESAVFHKSRLLYAIDKARDAIRNQKQVLVVEGYTDCISCHQAGVLNVVGTLGTALTDAHVTALKRFAQQVVLVFDGDDAGQNAARRAVERFLAQDVDLRILTLPEKLDPAEYLAAYNSDEFRQLVQAAPEAWDFQFRAARAQYGIDSVTGRQRILDDMLQLLSLVPSMAGSVRESLLIANLAQRLQLAEPAVRDRLSAVRGARKTRLRVDQHASRSPAVSRGIGRILSGRLSRDDRLEYDLLELLLAAPEHVGFVSRDISPEPLRNDILKHLLEHCLQAVRENGELTLSHLLGRVDDPELKSLIVWIDEQALAKGLAGKISEGGYDDDGCPRLLKRSLENLGWREAEQKQRTVSVQLSQETDGTGQLDEATEALLRQAAEFHQRRATRKSTV